MQLTINDTVYPVGMLALQRSWETETVYDLTTEDGVRRRQLRGVYPVYTLTLGNVDPAVYDALVAQLCKDAGVQTVTVPDGKTGFKTFQAAFTGIGDQLLLEQDGVRWWDSLTVTFTGCTPLEQA